MLTQKQKDSFHAGQVANASRRLRSNRTVTGTSLNGGGPVGDVTGPVASSDHTMDSHVVGRRTRSAGLQRILGQLIPSERSMNATHALAAGIGGLPAATGMGIDSVVQDSSAPHKIGKRNKAVASIGSGDDTVMPKKRRTLSKKTLEAYEEMSKDSPLTKPEDNPKGTSKTKTKGKAKALPNLKATNVDKSKGKGKVKATNTALQDNDADDDNDQQGSGNQTSAFKNPNVGKGKGKAKAIKVTLQVDNRHDDQQASGNSDACSNSGSAYDDGDIEFSDDDSDFVNSDVSIEDELEYEDLDPDCEFDFDPECDESNP